jgi:hypothetical protein
MKKIRHPHLYPLHVEKLSVVSPVEPQSRERRVFVHFGADR